MYHNYGMIVVTLNRLRLGAHIVTLADPSPDSYLQALHQTKSTALALTPSLMLWLAAAPSLPAERLERVHTVMCGGSPMAPDNTERLVSRLRPSVAFQQGYGCAETTAAICQTSRWERQLGTAGFLVPNTRAKVVGDGDVALGTGHTGEILVKGPQVMLGYLNDEAAMQRSFDAEGWFRTGDLGFYDDEHRFHVVDRLDEIIHVSGIHVRWPALAE
ncbi:Luciferin 4-monooxygenase, partial [Gryllus bimaculatus]